MSVLYKTHVATAINLNDGTTWTIPTEGLSWMLRYSHRQCNSNEALQLASIMDSFRALLEASQKRRNAIITKLKQEMIHAQNERKTLPHQMEA